MYSVRKYFCIQNYLRIPNKEVLVVATSYQFLFYVAFNVKIFTLLSLLIYVMQNIVCRLTSISKIGHTHISGYIQ